MLRRILWALLLTTLAAGSARAGRVVPTLTHQGQPPAEARQIKFYVFEEDKADGRNYVGWGDAERAARVPDGVYDIQVRFKVGFVERNRWFKKVEVTGDVALTADFDVPIARLTVDVVRAGAQVDPFTSRVAVYAAGKRDRPIGRDRPGRPMQMRPGLYDVEIRSMGPDGPDVQWLTEVEVGFGGAVDTFEAVAFGAPPAVLGIQITRNRRPVRPDEARWRIYRPGERENPLGEAEAGMMLSVPEGRYDLEVVVETETPPVVRWVENVEIQGEMMREIDVTVGGRFTVRVGDIGTRRERTWFGLFRPGQRDRPLDWARPGESMQVMPDTYDVGVFVRDGGYRVDRWRQMRLREDEVWQMDLEAPSAYLRVDPPKRRRRRRSDLGNPEAWLVVDRSATMADRWWDATVSALEEVLPDAASTLKVGMTTFGGVDGPRQCLATETPATPAADDRAALLDGYRSSPPAGAAPLGFAVSDLPIENPDPARSLIIVTASPDNCGKDVCRVVADGLREGLYGRAYVLALGMDPAAARRVDCAGQWIEVARPSQLRGELREALREAANPGKGTVNVLNGDGVVTVGTFGERLAVAEGRYEVLLHTGADRFRWQRYLIRGTKEATAGRRP